MKIWLLNFPVWVHALRHQTCWGWSKIGQDSPKCVKSVWRVCVSVWRRLWEWVKVWWLNFPVWVHTFGHPTCWGGSKFAKIAQSVWKVHEECVWVCEGVCESVWKYEHWVSQLEYMLSDTQHDNFVPKIAKIAKSVWKFVKSVWKCVKECVKVCESRKIESPSSSTCS